MNIEKKLSFIIELCDKHDITAYEIGKETDLNTSGVQRILNREVNKPRNKTLNTILDYIEEKITGSDIKGHVNYKEPQNKMVEDASSTYLTRDSVAIIKAIDILKITMERNQNVMATSLADLLLDTSEIKDGIKGLRGPLKDLVKLHNTRAKISS